MCHLTWVAILMLNACAARAQAPIDASDLTCESAEAVVRKAEKVERAIHAHAMMKYCGVQGVRALIAATRTWRHLSDRNWVEWFAEGSRSVRDPELFESLLEILADEASTPVARTMALRNLRNMRTPMMDVPLGNFEQLSQFPIDPLGPEAARLCGSSQVRHHTSIKEVRPLAAGQVERFHEVKAQLLMAPSTPQLLKAAAQCA